MIDPFRLSEAHQQARHDLLVRMHPEGFWTGRLASSALSTATAISALAIYQRHTGEDDPRIDRLIRSGIKWLASRQQDDGGWGDTDKSRSNIATTMLVAAAFHLTAVPEKQKELLDRADKYIEAEGGIKGLRRRYGKDKTFAVPILANCALADRVSWSKVASLPFEMACFPQSFYRFLRLPVVSYAIPALVAIGQAKYFHRKPWNPITRIVRRLVANKSLGVLEQIQPMSGGFLEAIPLTSFVVMSLASIGQHDHAVVQRGIEFLRDTARDDGSWPIDTNLATWNTSLSINALANSSEPLPESTKSCLPWLLDCQNTSVHPFTGADPGGWGWSDLSGAVPDADDTPGALLALGKFHDLDSLDATIRARITNAAAGGVHWLLDMQNRDGGWPTFCRGWGKLPFDRSGTDLTAHAVRALDRWKDLTPDPKLSQAIDRGFAYLAKQQRPDGAWIPLWFGNQFRPNEENPVYGTSKVLLAYRDLDRLQDPAALRGAKWLIKNQNLDHGWGGDVNDLKSNSMSSAEETSLAVEALMPFVESDDRIALVVQDALQWLVDAVQEQRHLTPSPIGLYFAKLWYYEDLYPVIFSASALAEACKRFGAENMTFSGMNAGNSPVNAS